MRPHGRKLSGGYALTHTRLRGDGRNWLLVKVTDEDAGRGDITDHKPESVLSNRVNEDL